MPSVGRKSYLQHNQLVLPALYSACMAGKPKSGICRSGTTYVTEYWKTDHVRTFGQLLFIGPANSHTHTLPVHCCINGLS